jgi:hypothetical protein
MKRFNKVRFVNNKKEIKKLLSETRFIPASRLPNVFVGMIDNDLVFADDNKLKEAIDETINYLKETLK